MKISNRKLRNISTLFLVFAIFLTSALYYQHSISQASSEIKGYIAIVIDDFGNKGEGTAEMLGMNIPITAAVMPFMPYSIEDAQAAHEAGLEVILHIPMEPVKGKPHWLGPKAITSNLSDSQVNALVQEAMIEIPFAVGVNNHMGSKITQDRRIMKAVLSSIKDKSMFYVDSKTTQNSVVDSVAEEMETPYIPRDVFLDNEKSQRSIEKKMDELAELALRRGYALGIGHVGPEGGTVTARAIKAKYKEFTEMGIKFIFVTDLIKVMEENNKNAMQ